MAYSAIRAANVLYSVSLVPEDFGVREDDGCVGTCNFRKAEIKFVRRPTPRLTAQTILHEIIHAIINGYRIKQLMNDDGDHDEDAVEQLSAGLDEVLTSIGVNIEEMFEGAHE